MIPLKALAWIGLTAQKANGEQIDSSNISKHLKDILALAGLLSPETNINVDEKSASDLRRFIAAVSDPEVMGQDAKAMETFQRLALAFKL